MCQLCFSRRDLMKMGAAGAMLPLLESAVQAGESYPPPAGDYLGAARQTAAWIRASARERTEVSPG
jgi:hypothetical protein